MKTKLAINAYLEYIKTNQNYSEKTVQEYTRLLKGYEEFLELNKVYRIEFVNEDILDRYSSYLRYKYSDDSIYLYKLVVKNLHRFIHFRYDIPNVAEFLPLPKRPQRLPVYCTRVEIEELLEYYHNNPNDIEQTLNKTIIEALYGLGIRVSELTNLDWKRVDLTNGKVIVNGKGDKDRIIPIPSKTLRQMKYYFENIRPMCLKKKSNYFFVTKHGSQISKSYVEIMIKTVVSNLKLRKQITPHKIRHTYATHLLEGGADIRTIQELLGHSSINTTVIYTHCDTNRMKNIYFDAMNKNFTSHNSNLMKLST